MTSQELKIERWSLLGEFSDLTFEVGNGLFLLRDLGLKISDDSDLALQVSDGPFLAASAAALRFAASAAAFL